ncbi:MAG: DUF5611 family protein [Thermoplasmata archaeon]|nr:DUF5611 family protein [Thermoplasmata archaeon]
MQTYPVRATHRVNLTPERLAELCVSVFGVSERDGERVLARFGAISRLAALRDGRSLTVDLVMDPKVPDELARDTIARYNRFLEEVTGYSSKERAKRMRKAAGD